MLYSSDIWIILMSDVFSAIWDFLNTPPIEQRKAVARALRSRLGRLTEWFKVQTIAHFYSSSLLFFFDNNSSSSICTSAGIRCVVVNGVHFPNFRMIDFAHVTFNAASPDEGRASLSPEPHFMPNMGWQLNSNMFVPLTVGTFCFSGYAFGLQTLIKILDRFITHC